jgi:hypothetical protein
VAKVITKRTTALRRFLRFHDDYHGFRSRSPPHIRSRSGWPSPPPSGRSCTRADHSRRAGGAVSARRGSEPLGTTRSHISVTQRFSVQDLCVMFRYRGRKNR